VRLHAAHPGRPLPRLPVLWPEAVPRVQIANS
jgi:hypothetical protein